MKSEYMQCGRCAGNGKIIKRGIQLELKDSDFEDCPNCDGTGELVCISRKSYEHYVRLMALEKESVDMNKLK